MDYRIEFSKTGNIRYISHLDLNRCMIRAVRRSGLPAWYTEGFHPHLYLMFPLALSLGAESECEVMDIRLTEEMPEEEILSRLNGVLPEGLYARSVRIPRNAAVEIGSAVYRVVLQTEDTAALAQDWEKFLAQEQLLVEKRTKKGMKEVDIRPMLECREVIQSAENLEIILKLPAGNEGNLNVSVVLDCFKKFAIQPFFEKRTVRIKIFCLDGKDFF